MKKKISAIIACYKDREAIPFMHERLTAVFRKIGLNYQILFVNDGSPDDTEEVLRHLVQKDDHVVAINHSRNFGSQMAFTSGMDIADGDAVVLLDGDLQDPPEVIEEFYHKWLEGFDVVYGVRIKREAPRLMQLLYKVFYRIFNKMSYIFVPLDAGDFSLIDIKVVKELRKLQERDRFLRGLRAWVGFKQVGVPYVRPERLFGKTTNNWLKNIDWAIKGILSFSFIPLRFITLLSFATFILSLIAIIVQVLLRFLLPHVPQGITTILVVMLFLGSIQLLGIGILGEYLAKILEEVKQRPNYIVKSIMGKSSAGAHRVD